MTDERYAFVEDVKNRTKMAKSGGKKGKSRYGCALPVDYMTTKEKHTANSQWISITYDRPISFDKFLAYSDEDKKKYLQNVIDNHGGTTCRIAEMFGCTEAIVKKFRQDLDIKNPVYKFGNADIDALWEIFLTHDEFLRKPMSHDDFKALDYYDQTLYISFLIETMGVTINHISSELFGKSNSFLRKYLNNHNISYYHNKNSYHMNEECIKAWNKWLGKDNEQNKEETQMTEEFNEEPEMKDNDLDINEPIEQPITTEPVTEIPSMQVSLRIDSMDQIIEMVKKLPRAKQGRLYFVWGGE